jgi:hypothetical protein
VYKTLNILLQNGKSNKMPKITVIIINKCTHMQVTGFTSNCAVLNLNHSFLTLNIRHSLLTSLHHHRQKVLLYHAKWPQASDQIFFITQHCRKLIEVWLSSLQEKAKV